MFRDKLYQKTNQRPFDEVFADPPALFRDVPFWAWNAKLDEEELLRQIGVFAEMGMGGFMMHARTGLDTPYLGPQFMACVKRCVEEAKKRGMCAFLYDEDRCPSGFAGGLVTKEHPEFRARRLVLTDAPLSSATLLAVYEVRLDADGKMAEARRVADGLTARPGCKLWHLYKVVAEPESWYNSGTYLDALNPAAVAKFLEITYETYAGAVGPEFGKTVPAIFIDEPQFTKMRPLKFATHGSCEIPYTEAFDALYREAYDEELLDAIPEVVWERADGALSLRRYRFHKLLAERFAESFLDQTGLWCEQHGILLCGHLMEEFSLDAQTGSVGDAMRCFRNFHFPGIDMLCDGMEFLTAKQAGSMARQKGCGGMLSELDGVTDWDFPFMGHKGHGDWQAALGVTLRIPHMAWYSMKGEAKRDYPASISFQSPWYRKYRLITDHFARLHAALTRGGALVRVAVIHPVESAWLAMGPEDTASARRAAVEEPLDTLMKSLLFNLIDFDFAAESELPQLYRETETGLQIGEMNYECVVIPPVTTLRSTTLDALEKFAARGGKIFVTGEPPPLADGLPSDRPRALYEKAVFLPLSSGGVWEELGRYAAVTVRQKSDGKPYPGLLCQLREEGDTRYLFIASTRRLWRSADVEVTIPGAWQVTLLHTEDGSQTPVAGVVARGKTRFGYTFYPHGHLLLKLAPSQTCIGETIGIPASTEEELEARTLQHLTPEAVPVTLTDDNVLLLDRARWRFGDETTFRPAEEILRIGTQLRAELGLPVARWDVAEPWSVPDAPPVTTVELAYDFVCDAAVDAARLAMECAREAELWLDGAGVTAPVSGWWLDPSHECRSLPPLAPGRHTLTLRIAYRNKDSLERLFLLGDFGVRLAGLEPHLTPPVRTLFWGDATVQGLPFYAGNLIYHTDFMLEKEESVTLRIPSRLSCMMERLNDGNAEREVDFCGFRGVLLSVSLDGREAGDVAFAPYELALGTLPAGRHTLDLTLYGSRVNAEGTLHQTFRDWSWPGAWRSHGDMYAREYRVRPFGIITAPRLLR